MFIAVVTAAILGLIAQIPQLFADQPRYAPLVAALQAAGPMALALLIVIVVLPLYVLIWAGDLADEMPYRFKIGAICGVIALLAGWTLVAIGYANGPQAGVVASAGAVVGYFLGALGSRGKNGESTSA